MLGMPKNAVTDWDITPGANSDIGGVNIAEGCPAAGINDAIRSIMAQIAAWIVSATGPVIKIAGGLIANTQQVADSAGNGQGIGYRNIPLTAKTAAYQIALADVGQGITITTGGITVPVNATTAFAVGDTILIYNNSGSSQTITAAGALVLRLAGTATTGNRTLAQYGVCTLIKLATDEWVASGMGVA